MRGGLSNTSHCRKHGGLTSRKRSEGELGRTELEQPLAKKEKNHGENDGFGDGNRRRCDAGF